MTEKGDFGQSLGKVYRHVKQSRLDADGNIARLPG
jgi:hypothetical protein